MKFENGLTISIIWGYGNYCDHNNKFELTPEKDIPHFKSTTAEMAIFDDNGGWVTFNGDTVKGWLTPEEVANYISKTKDATSVKDLCEGELDLLPS